MHLTPGMYIESDAPLDQLRTLHVMGGKQAFLSDGQTVDITMLNLTPSPFSSPEQRGPATFIRDLANRIVYAASSINFDDLINTLSRDPHVRSLGLVQEALQQFLENIVKAGIASKGYKLSKTRSGFELSLSLGWMKREKERQFASTAADELQSLSQRMESIVPHQGERGRYREDLLRVVLERTIPQRYHVATGFILGCSRQLDILIYDAIDYVPIFREGGVVVVPPEAVRAVIEVKTTLSKGELWDALSKLDAVSYTDDGSPPFFKGVFAFNGPVRPTTTTRNIQKFYRIADEFEVMDSVDDPHEEDNANGKDEAESSIESDVASGMFQINEPFKHLTCACIDKAYFAEIVYAEAKTDDGLTLLAPAIRTIASKTGLSPQTALFIQILNQYLQVPTLKQRETEHATSMIGADLLPKIQKVFYAEPWGPYLAYDTQAVTKYIEQYAMCISKWRQSGVWDEPSSRPW